MLEEVFQKSIPDYSKLIKYGFKVINDIYEYEEILLDSFKLKVMIKESVKIKVYDLDSEEEYTNFRIQGSGEFAGTVRANVERILLDIKDKCFISQYFISKQANRISKLIKNKYGDSPYFEWDNYPDFGVFKNSETKKWYALIMNIARNKLDDNTGNVDVLNVKIDSKKIEDLLKEKGYYPAYHMNKKYWLSIILDDTLTDDTIMSLIEESYSYTERGKRSNNEWIIPANPNYFDIDEAFNNSKTIIWKQSTNIKVGDIIYLYVGSPVSAIRYKCRVEEVNIPYDYNDQNVKMKYVMKIKLLDSYNKELFPFSKLKEYGVNAIRGPRFMPKELSNYINKKEG